MNIIVFDTALKQGGIVVFDGEYKVYERSKLTLKQLWELFCSADHIYAEEVQLFSAGKIALANKFEAKGQLEAFAAMCDKEITYISAKKWQKHFGYKKEKLTDYQWKKFLWEEACKIINVSKEAADAVLITKYVLDEVSLLR